MRIRGISISPGLIIFLFLLIFGLASLFYPFGRDQGIHAQVGGAWLEGQLPYRDVWHPKGFLSFVPHVLATAVFGHTMWGIRLIDLLWQFGIGLLIFQIGKRRLAERGALLAVFLYYMVYYSFGFWHTAQPEGFLVLLVLLGVWFFEGAAEAKRPLGWLFVSGFTMALAPWFKQTAVVFMAALLLWAAAAWWKTGRRRTKLAALGAGMLAATGLMVGFAAVTGMLPPMIEAYSYIFEAYPQRNTTSAYELLKLTISWGIWFPALIFPFGAGLAYIVSNRQFWAKWFGPAAMALAGLASVYIQRQLWFYHWVSSLPFMVLIGAFMLDNGLNLLESLPKNGRKGMGWLALFVCISFALPVLNRNIDSDLSVIRYLIGRNDEAQYLAEFGLDDMQAVADYVAAETAEGTPIYIWGHYAMIYYLADRPNPTRFNIDTPLSLPHRQQTEWRQEVMADLTAEPPAYIIVATNDRTTFETQSSKAQLPDFPALAEFLTANYEFERLIGTFELYKAVSRP